MSRAAEGSGHTRAEKGPAKGGPGRVGRRTDISTDQGAGRGLEGQEMAVLTMGTTPHAHICWREWPDDRGLEGDSRRLEPRLRRAEGLPGGSPSNRCGTRRRAGAGRWVDLAVASVEVPFGRLQQRRKQGHQLRERAGGGGVGREGRWERTRAVGGVPGPSARRRRRNAATRFPGLCRSTER